jgi:hypothetical protein
MMFWGSFIRFMKQLHDLQGNKGVDVVAMLVYFTLINALSCNSVDVIENIGTKHDWFHFSDVYNAYIKQYVFSSLKIT